MFSFIAPLVIITTGTSFLARLTRRRFEQVLPLYFMGAALLVYFLGFLGHMSLGYGLLLAFSAAFPLCLLYRKLFKKETLESSLRPILTPGFTIFLLIYVIIFALNFRHQLFTWDSLSHWGPMVKETFRLDDFYNSSASVLSIHADYPPIITIFETIFCKFTGGISDSSLYCAIQIFDLSLLLPFLSKLSWRRLRPSSAPRAFAGNLVSLLALTIFILLVPTLVYMQEANFYSSIYIDVTLALLLAFGLATITLAEQRDKFFTVTLALLFSFLVLAKQIAIVFVLLLLVYLIILLIVEHRHHLAASIKQHYRALIPAALLLIGLPLLCLSLWNSRVQSLGLTGQFSAAGVLKDTASALATQQLEPWQSETITNFANRLISPSHLGGLVSLSYVQLFILFPLVIFLVCKITHVPPARRHTLIAISILGGLGYAALMLLLYLFAFGPVEGPALASYVRYTNTYWLALAALLAALLLHAYASGEQLGLTSKTTLALRPTHFFAATLLVLAFGFGEDAYFWLLRRPNTASVYAADTTLIRSHADENSKVFIVDATGNGYHTFALQYLLAPTKINTSNFTPTTSDLTALAADYDYLYIYSLDDQFTADHAASFASPPAAHHLYRLTDGRFEIIE